MNLRRKSALGFYISALLVATLVVFGYVEFVEIKKEIVRLELSDTIRSKTLQLRRHEKNYFLYRSEKEMQGISDYIAEIKSIIAKTDEEGFKDLSATINEYEERFNSIISIFDSLNKAVDERAHGADIDAHTVDYVKATLFDNPLLSAEMLLKSLRLKRGDPIIMKCAELDREVGELRKTGEKLLSESKAFDDISRRNVERAVRRLQAGVIFFLPLFLATGLGITFFFSRNLLSRLNVLSDEIEKTKRGLLFESNHLAFDEDSDEIERVIYEFKALESELAEREHELIKSKKLSAIGTLASGVAHELNNPLNNIYTTAQRLVKKSGEDCDPHLKKGLDDILAQSMRVKKIVGELIEFARSKEPRRKAVDVESLVADAFSFVKNTIDIGVVQFNIESRVKDLRVLADPTQLEQVFINLFTNAVEAMNYNGTITVRIEPRDGHVFFEVADTGGGMSSADTEKIFEPFFSTKEKGTGLGLAVVYNIINKHGGKITAASVEGEGTIFFFDLPGAEKESD